MREPFLAALSWSDASILSTNSISPVISRSKLNGDERGERYGGNGSAGGHARPDSAICPQVPQAEDEAAGGADTGDDPVLGVHSGLHHAPLQRFEICKKLMLNRLDLGAVKNESCKSRLFHILKWLVENFNGSCRMLTINSTNSFVITPDDVADFFQLPRYESTPVLALKHNETVGIMAE
nr:hypothetical protein Iba_chr15fCG5590 [Ipomoea batatas]